jgi:2'-5' RNA ligase
MSPYANEQTRARYLLMLPVPRAIEVKIEDRFLPRLGATRPSMGYHVSIAGPFFWVHEAHEPALERVQRVCAELSPARLAVQGIDVFENAPDDCAVFIEIGPVRRLRRLHRHVLGALGSAVSMQYQRSGHFRPHITLGLNLPSHACDSLRQNAGNPWRAHFLVTEMWLIEQRPQNPWRPLLSFSLGTGDAPHPLSMERNDG